MLDALFFFRDLDLSAELNGVVHLQLDERVLKVGLHQSFVHVVRCAFHAPFGRLLQQKDSSLVDCRQSAEVFRADAYEFVRLLFKVAV